jgi:hypothetical protein
MYAQLIVIRSVLHLLVTAKVVSSSLILVTLMMEAIHSSEISVSYMSYTVQHPDDGILHRKLISRVPDDQQSPETQ